MASPTLLQRLDPRRNLRIRIALLFGAAATVFAILGGYIESRMQEEALRQTIGASYRQLAFAFGGDIADGVRERYEDLRFAATLPEFRDGEAAPTRAIRRELLDRLKATHPEFAWIGLADRKGVVLVATAGVLEGQNVSARPWFGAGLAGAHIGNAHEALLLKQHLDPGGREPLRLMDIAVPVRDATGVRGVLAAHLYVNWADRTLAAMRGRLLDAGDAEVLLLDGEGTVIAGRSPGHKLLLPAGERSGVAVMADGGTEYLHGFHRIGESNSMWGFEGYVVVRRPVESAFAPARNAAARSYMVALVLGLGFVILGFFLSHRIARLEVLQERLAQFELVADNLPVGIAYYDRDQVVRFANRRAAALMGWDERDVVGKTVAEIVGAESYERIGARIRVALGGESLAYTREITSRTGQRSIVDVSLFPNQKDGAVRGAYAVFHDVTGKARAEGDLRRKSEEMENVLETMAEGLAIVDEEGRIVMVNAAAERIFGAPRATILGRHREDVPWSRLAISGTPLQLDEQPFSRLKSGANRIDGLEYDIVTADGRTTAISVNAVAIRDADGAFRGMMTTLTDVTERRRAEDIVRRSARRMATTIDSALDAIVTVDHRGDIVDFNPAAEHCFGHSRAAVLGRALAEMLVPPSHRARHREAFRRYLESGESQILGRRIELPAMRADGSQMEIEIAIIRLPDEDPPVFTAFLRDITERKKADERLRHAQERLDRAMGASAVALFEIEVATGRSYLSESWSTMLGGPAIATDTTIADLLELTHPDDRDAIWQVALEAIRGKRDGYEMEHRMRNLSGDWIWVLSRSRVVERDAEGRAVRMLGTNVDITDRKRAEQRIHYLATRDALTDLHNRALFADQLANALGDARRNEGRLALLAIGLDRFTTINDSLGHEAGDTVLKRVAERISACANPRDTVARPGGDEFLVLISRIDSPTDVSHAAEAIRNAIAMPLAIARRERVVTASIGVALFPDDGDSAGELLRNAGTALHHAKASGRNNVQFFTEGMNAAVRARLETEAELRMALDRDEFELHFQPQVELATGALVGWEALLRWRHPEQGLVLPGRFIGTAEETGLIVPIGQCVLMMACRQAVAWNRTSGQPTRMAVNVTARQFRHPGFVRGVKDALDSTGLDARLLELEIIENAIMGHGPEVASTLRGLGELGVELSIDDFGTGYSSLSYLKNLPLDTVKIDQSFVRDIPGGRESCAIVNAVINLAHGLGLKVVAEGVENGAQADFLRGLGCDIGQGYFFGRPEPPEHWAGDNAANVIKLRRA